jgi:hypothetical protein
MTAAQVIREEVRQTPATSNNKLTFGEWVDVAAKAAVASGLVY